MRRLLTKCGTDMFIFDSVTDVMQYMDPSCYEKEGTSEWVGANLRTWEDVMAMVSKEWKHGLDTIQQFVEELKKAELPELKSHKRRVQFNEMEGDEIDYDRLRGGQSFWRKSVREDVVGPLTVTIFTDVSTSCGKKSEDILWRGAAAIALTQILEEKGYSVELWITSNSNFYQDSDQLVSLVGNLKRCSDPCDLSSLVSSVAGWYFRSVIFTLCKTVGKKTGHGHNSWLGYPKALLPSDLDEVSSDKLRAYSAGVYSFGGALRLMQDEIEKLANHTGGQP